MLLGSILLGFATPTESASVGAVGAIILAALNRRLSFEMIYYAARNTMVTTSIIFVIVLAASMFSLVFRGLGGEHMVDLGDSGCANRRREARGTFWPRFAVLQAPREPHGCRQQQSWNDSRSHPDHLFRGFRVTDEHRSLGRSRLALCVRRQRCSAIRIPAQATRLTAEHR